MENTDVLKYGKLMKAEPLVSIITAAYNCEATIAETIESVLAQTYSNWEMLIVNDCSTDNTALVVDRYTSKDERIKFFTLPVNSGAGEARNEAIRQSKGRFIAILDSDDLWKPEKLAHQIAFMLDNHHVFTFTTYETFHNRNDKVRRIFKAPERVNYKQYLKNTIIGNLTVVIDKEKIPDLRIQKGHLEDVLTWMYVLKQGYVAYGLNENLASYRVYLSSKSGNKLRNAKRYYDCLREQDIPFTERIIDEVFYVFNATKKRLFGEVIRYEHGCDKRERGQEGIKGEFSMSTKVLLLNPPFLDRYSKSSRSPAVTKSATVYYPLWLSYAGGGIGSEGI